MVSQRTSKTHPLQIAEVPAGENGGLIGITFCPGKHDPMAHTGAWARDLEMDLDVIKDWQAVLVLTLVAMDELVMLKVPDIGQQVERRGMLWRHLPIRDYSITTDEFEHQWLTTGKEIRDLLRSGKNIVVHCKGGLGRAGMMAARLLAELGTDPDEAIKKVRRARSGAIETPAQVALIRRTQLVL